MKNQIKIAFVSGKGGVGKSVLSAALAVKKAQSGFKTLLVELGEQSFYKDFFQKEEAFSFRPHHLRENLDVALWSNNNCLKEYALHLLKSESLYQLFFENRISRTLIEIAPGLKELSLLGKITSGPPRNVGPALPYDCLVIDAYSTGHFISLLNAPHGMKNAIKIGPMGEQCRQIINVLKDPLICHYFIASLPEELAIKEACELSSFIFKQTQIRPTHLINKIIDFPKELIEEKYTSQVNNFQIKAFQNYLKQAQLNQEKALLDLKKNEDTVSGIFKLPLIFSNNSLEIVESLAKELPDA